MNWRQTARWVVAAVGVGCAIALVVYSRRRPDPPARPPALEKVDPTAKLQGGAGQQFHYRTGKSTITVTFANTRAYDDGRAHFEQVVIEGLEESRFTVHAAVMESSAPEQGLDRPKQLNLSGGVTLKTDDGLELSSKTAVWDDAASQLTMPGPVTFQKGRVSGTGTGAIYDRQHDSFNLLANAQAHVNPDATGHGGAELSSARMNLIRGQHIVLLEENAKILGETQTLTARNATLSFTDDEKAMKYVELREAAHVTPNAVKPPAAAANRPAMEADNISMSFYEDGVTLQHAGLTGRAVLTITGETTRTVRGSWIDLTTAPDGQTLTSLQAKDRVSVIIPATSDAPGRTITSAVLVATGDPKKGLTSARFDGNPRFEETTAAGAPQGAGAPAPAPGSRWGTAVVLVLVLGGQIDAIERADFQQNAEFHDGDVKGTADVAQYEEANGLLHLKPNPTEPRKRSHVDTPDMNVDASTIHVETGTDNLQAEGNVVTHSAASTGAIAQPAGLFGGDEPIIGSAEALSFTKNSGVAVYTGSPRAQASLRQGQSVVSADKLEYSDTTRNLNGLGKVDSIWWLEPGTNSPNPKNQPLKSQRVRADTMAYDDAKRIAVYKGTLVRVKTSDSEVEGRTVIFRLAQEARALQSMHAETAVWATLSDGYEAVGDVLDYDATKETYTLNGLAGKDTAQVRSPRSDSTTMCNLNVGMRLVLNRTTGRVEVPGEGQAPRNTDTVLCTMSLRR